MLLLSQYTASAPIRFELPEASSSPCSVAQLPACRAAPSQLAPSLHQCSARIPPGSRAEPSRPSTDPLGACAELLVLTLPAVTAWPESYGWLLTG